jgi:hypothetical protein
MCLLELQTAQLARKKLSVVPVEKIKVLTLVKLVGIKVLLR